jgi:hypothetical protein
MKNMQKKKVNTRFPCLSHEVRKRGQITIFIILAVIVIMALLVYFIWLKPLIIQTDSEKLQIESCLEDSMQESINYLLSTAGVINPDFTLMYNGENITYLCYSDEYYTPCVNQNPLIKNKFQQSLKELITSDVNGCYESSVNELRSLGYDVKETDNVNFVVTINPNDITINLKALTLISQGESGSVQEDFQVKVDSNVYDLLMLSTTIVQFETEYGDSSTDILMYYYPDYRIEKKRVSEGNKVYILTDKKTEEQIKFAVRSYAWPAGYGVQ